VTILPYANRTAALSACLVLGLIGVACSGEEAYVEDSDSFLRVFAVRQDGQEFDVVSLLSPDDAFTGGIPLVAQVGLARHSAHGLDGIKPADFRPNPAFVNLLHNTIGAYGPQLDDPSKSSKRNR